VNYTIETLLKPGNLGVTLIDFETPTTSRLRVHGRAIGYPQDTKQRRPNHQNWFGECPCPTIFQVPCCGFLSTRGSKSKYELEWEPGLNEARMRTPWLLPEQGQGTCFSSSVRASAWRFATKRGCSSQIIRISRKGQTCHAAIVRHIEHSIYGSLSGVGNTQKLQRGLQQYSLYISKTKNYFISLCIFYLNGHIKHNNESASIKKTLNMLNSYTTESEVLLQGLEAWQSSYSPSAAEGLTLDNGFPKQSANTVIPVAGNFSWK